MKKQRINEWVDAYVNLIYRVEIKLLRWNDRLSDRVETIVERAARRLRALPCRFIGHDWYDRPVKDGFDIYRDETPNRWCRRCSRCGHSIKFDPVLDQANCHYGQVTIDGKQHRAATT